MLATLASLTAIFGLWVGATRLLRTRAEFVLLPVLSLVMLLLVAGGLMGILTQTVLLLQIAGISSMALACMRRQGFGRFATPSVAIFLGIVALLALINIKVQVHSWDEFSHWAQVTKFLALSDRLPAAGEITFGSYPVGLGLLQYFLGPQPTDDAAWVVAANILKLSAILPMAALIRWRHWPNVVLLFAIAIVLPRLLKGLSKWDDLLPDTTLALMVSGALAIYIRGGRSAKAMCLALPVIAVLPQVKDIGVSLGAVVVGMMLADQAILAYARRRADWRSFAVALLPLPVMLAVKSVWSWHLATAGINPAFALRTAGEAASSSYALDVGSKFLEALVTLKFGLGILYFPILVVFGLGLTYWAVVLHRGHLNRLRTGAMLAVLFTGLWCYLALLLFLYAYAFSPAEAGKLASLQRYTNTYLLFWFMSAIAFMWRSLGNIRSKATIPLTSAISITAIGLLAGQAYMGATSTERSDVARALYPQLRALPDNARVYGVWAGTRGFEAIIAGYEAMPLKIGDACFSPGPKRSPEDIWSCDLSPDQFVASFRDFTHLFLGRTDTVFWATYGDLFSANTDRDGDRLFSLQQDQSGRARFTPLRVATRVP